MDALIGTTAGAVAATRFGLGARPGEIAAASADPRGWLDAQATAPVPTGSLQPGSLPTAAEAYAQVNVFVEGRRGMRAGSSVAEAEIAEMARAQLSELGALLAAEIAARTRIAATTEASWRERQVRFWSNHFSVSATKLPLIALAGPFEREAIRPNVTGSFADLLIAAESSWPRVRMIVLLSLRTRLGWRGCLTG